MDEIENAPWLKMTFGFYTLQHHGWRLGKEQFCNRFSAQFSAGPGCTEEELIGYVDLAHAAPDMAMALELIAADSDAGNSRLTSGVRMALDAALIKAGRKEAPVRTKPCKTCGGTRVVDDGEITGSGGVEFENGPIKCVKDCPDCQKREA